VLERLADTGVRDRLRAELEPAIGGWADIAVAGEVDESRRELLGKDVLSAAADAGADPVDFLCDLLLAETLDVMLLGLPSSHPDTIPGDERLAADHRHLFGSDGIFRGGHVHPRAYGGCARFVGRMTRAGTLSLEEAVRHATSAPAERFGLAQRGRIAPAYAADVVVFDASRFEDRATREEPRRPAVGVRDVWVNGVAALRDGEPTGASPGRALERGAR
jgi:N-acyl-D-aspartate/D-glutamate deacylase